MLNIGFDYRHRACNSDLCAVDAQVIVVKISPYLIGIIPVIAGSVLINFLYQFLSLIFCKVFSFHYVLHPVGIVTIEEYSYQIIPVAENIVGASSNKYAVPFFGK